MKKLIAALVLLCGLPVPLMATDTIDQEVANMYNDGIVRCANESCAKYLYACFRSFSAGPLQPFLDCGSQAARLNDNKMVVPES
jgi:hypothetical protein